MHLEAVARLCELKKKKKRYFAAIGRGLDKNRIADRPFTCTLCASVIRDSNGRAVTHLQGLDSHMELWRIPLISVPDSFIFFSEPQKGSRENSILQYNQPCPTRHILDIYRHPGGTEQQERQQWQRFRPNAGRVNAYASTPDNALISQCTGSLSSFLPSFLLSSLPPPGSFHESLSL